VAPVDSITSRPQVDIPNEAAMSHKTTIKTEIYDIEALKKACEKFDEVAEIKVAEKGQEIEGRLYQGTTKGAAVVKFKSWNYPVIIKTDGTVEFDNYGGNWGDQKHLDKLSQLYAAEAVVQKVKTKGLRILSQETTAEGRIRIQAQK
jgi:gamma-glutamylcyclotransferase (GGCT)/AIG2-like uncharacterized protein YtfP